MTEPDIDPVALEHRLTSIEGAIGAGFERIDRTVGEVRDAVVLQNGRLGKLETEQLKDQARRDVRKRDLAWVGVGASILPGVIAAVAVFW